jgi:hypothetical protein
MTTTAKIIILLVVSVILIAAAAVGVAVLLVSRYGGELAHASQRNVEQGVAFGRETDEAGCLAEAIARYKANRGLSGSLGAGMFEQGCLRASRPSAGFCDDVPSPLDFLRGGRWQMDQARRAGIHDQFSSQIFAQVQAYCDTKARTRPDASAKP